MISPLTPLSSRITSHPADDRSPPFRISEATADDRKTIYANRHEVYARELGQHQPNDSGRLSDPLDEFNVYLVAQRHGAIAGFVSLTPPGDHLYSVDKYFARDALPFAVDAGLWKFGC